MGKKIIFLVDHKYRDFSSISLIGYFLEKKGHHVYFKKLHEPDVEIINPDVIVEAKYSRPKNYIKKIEKWQKKNIKIVVMETEGIIQWKGFKPLMNYKPDFCFFWNNYHGYEYDQKFYQDKTIVLGCPRSDFLHESFKEMREVSDISDTLNIDKNLKTITIATPNSYEDLPQIKIDAIKKRYAEVHKSSTSFENLILHMKHARKSITSFCEDMLKLTANFNIIIKPHPNENIHFWKNFAEKLNDNRIKILVGKTIQDLLSISDLHVAKSGCLTLPEAALSKINTIELLSNINASKEILFEEHTHLGTYNINNFFEIKEELINILNGQVPSQIKEKNNQIINNYINNYFHKFDGKRCYQYANEFDKYLNNLQNFNSNKKNLLSYAIYLIFFIKKELKKIYRLLTKKTLIDNRGRYDNRVNDEDKKKNFLKFEKMECIKKLLND